MKCFTASVQGWQRVVIATKYSHFSTVAGWISWASDIECCDANANTGKVFDKFLAIFQVNLAAAYGNIDYCSHPCKKSALALNCTMREFFYFLFAIYYTNDHINTVLSLFSLFIHFCFLYNFIILSFFSFFSGVYKSLERNLYSHSMSSIWFDLSEGKEMRVIWLFCFFV